MSARRPTLCGSSKASPAWSLSPCKMTANVTLTEVALLLSIKRLVVLACRYSTPDPPDIVTTQVCHQMSPCCSHFSTSTLTILLSRLPGMLSALSMDERLAVLQGSIEDWLIENRASEAHIFHIHQVRYALSVVCVLYLWWRESGHAMACPAGDD